ncbi:MAG: indolepyruvate ferredoxin oxidoreductase subunit alpha [bacterium]
MELFLESAPGGRHLLLGNEAVSRGALEAGVAVATTYPGTPATEIGDVLSRLSAQTDRYYFEYSVNEKVALEVAAGAAVAGVRAIVSMKHVGLNVASDTMMTLAYLGVNAGLVIVTADEPGCHSSQNEQDNRLYARLANLPLLEPATPQEAKDMTRYGLELSERLQLPVILRMTTRVSHMRGAVTFGALPDEVKRVAEFQRDLSRFAYNPGLARKRRKVLLTQMAEAERLAEAADDLNFVVGQGRLGVLTSGVGFNYTRDAVSDLDLQNEVQIAKLGFSYPVPPDWLRRFLVGVDRCLVVEEVEPLLEQHAKALAHEHRLDVVIEGRATGRFPRDGELGLVLVRQVLADLTGRELIPPEVATPPALPIRPPSLCPGCSHRNTFYAVKLVSHYEGTYSSDIGCYTLGQLPPLNLCDLLICMGSSINTAAGFYRSTDRPAFAFIGDGTFFHSGMTGLVNAVHNKHKLVLVVMDNRTTAMTGHQPHPGSPLDGMHEPAPQVDIADLCVAAGATFVETLDPADLRRTVDTFQRAMDHDSVAVVITRAPCLFVNRPPIERTVFQVNQERCCHCGICDDHSGCGESASEATQLTRALARVNALEVGGAPTRDLPDKPAVAPCSLECPAHVCVQSYATLIAAGLPEQAARAVRERLPLPATVGRVCHRPCEPVCTRADIGSDIGSDIDHRAPVAINALKRYATEHEDHAAVARELAQQVAAAPTHGQTVGIVGSGPAGLAAAHDLRLRGFGVTIYEAAPKAGGMLALGIPAYRLPRAVLDREVDLIVGMGVDLRLSTRVGTDLAFDDLQSRHDALLVAAGAWKGVRLDLEGADASGVLDALTFLEAANLGRAEGVPVPKVGKQVLVIGGGDAAIDAARVAHRLGGHVTVVYRRSREEMPAADDEIRAAEAEGITIRLLTAPAAIQTANDRVTALTVIRTELGEPDQSGRRRPVPVQGSEESLPCDTIIAAIGQRPDLSFLPNDVALTKWGTLETDANVAQYPALFAAGDAVTGPKTVIHAIAAGQRAAREIDAYLAKGRWQVADVVGVTLDSAETGRRYVPEQSTPADRIESVSLPRAERKGFDEVEQGFTPQEAAREAARCLVCGRCAKCRICIETFGCPAILLQDGRITIDEVLCVGCGVCAQLCPNNAILPVRPEP